MKRFLFIMICTLATLTSQAQEFEDAIYIYRNDGPLNAFVYAELDSITLSHYDADSVCHKEIVSQVFHAPDTAFVIPIAAIDSVSFVQPEVKMSGKVNTDATCELFKYENGIAYLTLDTDEDYLPAIGEIIYNDEERKWINSLQKLVILPQFSGKVTSVTRTSEAYEVRLTPVTDLSEIFDQLIGVEVTPGFARSDEDESYARQYITVDADGNLIYPDNSNGPKKAQGSFSYDYAFNCSIGLDSITAGGNWKVNAYANLEGKFALKVVYEITKERKYVGVEVKPTFILGGSLGAKREPRGNGDLIKPKWIQPGITVPFPSFLPIFRFSTSFYPFIKAEGSMEFNAGFKTPEMGFRISFGYNNGSFPGSFNLCFGDSPKPEANARFSINGSLMAGLGAEFKLGTVDWLNIFDAVAELRVGPKLSVDAGIDMFNINNTGSAVTSNLYDALKDSKLGLSLTTELDIKGKLGTSGHEYTFASLSHDYYSREWYLMPEFEDLTVEQPLPARYTFSYKPTRNVLFQSVLGCAICAEDGTMVEKWMPHAEYYRGEADWEDKHPDKLYHSNDSTATDLSQYYIPTFPRVNYVAPYLEVLGMKLYSRDWKEVNFSGCPNSNHPHKIDLGTGVRWACCYGGQPGGGWGEFIGNGEKKYSYKQDPPVTNIAGTQWDTATQKWGAPWRLPTIGDVESLMEGTEHILRPEIYGDKTYNVILASAGGNYIFLPLNTTFLTSTCYRAAFTENSTTDIWSYGHDDYGSGLNTWKNCSCDETQYERFNLKITQANGLAFPCTP